MILIGGASMSSVPPSENCELFWKGLTQTKAPGLKLKILIGRCQGHETLVFGYL